MNIALFHNLPSGGAKRHTFEQVRELSKRGYQITEFAPSTADLNFCSLTPFITEQRIFNTYEPDLINRIPFITPYIHLIQGIKFLNTTERTNTIVAREIDQGEFDLVMVKDCRIIGNPYVLKYLATPNIFQCHHGLGHKIKSRNINHLERITPVDERVKQLYFKPARSLFNKKLSHDEKTNIRFAHRVITNSKYSSKEVSSYYNIESDYVYPGINTKTFKPIDTEKGDYVLSVGEISYRKGYRFLITALSHIDSTRRPTLHIIANSEIPGERRIIEEMADKNEIKLIIERVLDDTRLVQAYNQAQAFVYSPIQEALGMAPLEAMACGLPVIAVSDGGVSETVHDGEVGWLVNRDPQDFAIRLEALLFDNTMKKNMGAAAVNYIRKNWTWENAVDCLENQFHELLDYNNN